MNVVKDGMGTIHGDGLSGWVFAFDHFFSLRGELTLGTGVWFLVDCPGVILIL